MSRKPYWEQTPAEVACGRCDADRAGDGAQVTSYRGALVVLCAACVKAEAAEATAEAGTRPAAPRPRSAAEAA